MIDLSVDDVRAIALWRQGFSEPIGGVSASRLQRGSVAVKSNAVRQMVRVLSAVQLDTISVLARSHELVAYARFGAIGREAIEQAYWDGTSSFEYWSHAACILPIDSWPLFEFRRREYRRKGIRWHEVPQQAVRDVRARLAADGPLTTRELGGAKRAGEWWDWSDTKIAVEWLLDTGEVVCARRQGWRRVYDLAERVIPEADLQGPLDDDECLVGLIADAARTLGVGTIDDIADVHRLPKQVVRARAADAGLVPVGVEGWTDAAFATSEALRWREESTRVRSRTTLLSPFDSLVWHRPRTERIFGIVHRLEAYTPASKRVHGYFAMPVLHRGRIVARVDPKREGGQLHARRVTFESTTATAVAGTAAALREAATWVGAQDLVIGDVVPARARTALLTALRG